MALLDASAVIAVLFNERGSALVTEHLEGATLLTVSLEEVVRALYREAVDTRIARRVIEAIDVAVVDFTREMTWRSAELGPLLSPGLGFADRACLAAASVLDLPVVTSEAQWSDAGQRAGVRVISIR